MPALHNIIQYNVLQVLNNFMHIGQAFVMTERFFFPFLKIVLTQPFFVACFFARTKTSNKFTFQLNFHFHLSSYLLKISTGKLVQKINIFVLSYFVKNLSKLNFFVLL